MHRARIAVLALAVLGISACVNKPPGPEGAAPDKPSEVTALASSTAPSHWLPARSRVAIAVGRFEPPISVDGDARPGQFAGTGAIQGAAACANALQGGGAIGGALFLICAPFASLAGAAGAIDRAAPADAAASKASMMRSATEGLYVSAMFESAMERIARRYDLAEAMLREEGPASVSDEPIYATADYVVELRIARVVAATPATITLPYRFVLVAEGRLIRTSDNAVIDKFSMQSATRQGTAEQWAAGRNDLLSRELGLAMDRIAANYLHEWVLLYRGPPLKAASAADPSPAPDYVLRPIDPPFGRKFTLNTKSIFPTLLVPAQVSSTTPTLTWEKLPRTIPEALFAGPDAKAQDLSYDVLIFEGQWSGKGSGVFHATQLVRAHSKIAEPKLELAPPLKPCKHYFWTVRAQFELEGRRRVTEWSGAYVLAIGEVEPRTLRRTQYPGSVWVTGSRLPQQGYYFPFKTPWDNGKRCNVIQ